MEIDEFDFKWGVKKEVGVSHSDRGFQYYDSFTYRGDEYSLYDCACFYDTCYPTTHIGKLVKLYETPARERKVEALWFFRPMDMRRFLGNVEPKWNELFLASGQGKGLSNTNDVEKIVSKCYVICTSKDKRNSQVSRDKLEEAEYFFYRTFDVGSQTISEKFPDEIAGVKVEFLFNGIEDQNLNRPEVQKLGGQASVSSRIEPIIGAGSPAKKVMPTSRKSSLFKDLEEGASIVGERRSCASGNLNLKRPPVESQNLNRPELRKAGEQVNVSSRIEPSIGAGSPSKNVMPSSRKNSLLKDLEESTFIVGERRSCASENLNLKRPPVESQNLNRPELQKLGDQVNVSSRIVPSIGAGCPAKTVMPASRKNSLLKDLEQGASILGERRSCASENLNLKRSPVEKGTKLGREVKDMSKVRSLGDSFTENIEDTRPLKKRPNLVDGKNSISQKEGPFMVANAIRASENPGARLASDRSLKSSKQVIEVTRRPDAERRNWFKQLPWEERLQKAQEAGSLVLLENLDPSFSSFEVEDLVWTALNEKVAARMIQSSTFSSPIYGKAFVIFKSKVAAEAAILELNRRCLVMADGRPIIGRRRNLRVPSNTTSFFGHLVVDKLKLQRQSYEMRTAISTAHCAQPNTLEYDMALQWLELQEKSDLCWKALYKDQLKEISDLKSRLKLSRNG